MIDVEKFKEQIKSAIKTIDKATKVIIEKKQEISEKPILLGEFETDEYKDTFKIKKINEQGQAIGEITREFKTPIEQVVINGKIEV